MKADSQAGSDTCCPPSLRCISSQSQNCWQTTCDLIRRAWEVSVVFVIDAWDCMSRRCACCNDEPSSEIGETSSTDTAKHDEHKIQSKDGAKDQAQATKPPTSPSAIPRTGSLGQPPGQPTAQKITIKPTSPSQTSTPQTIASTQTTIMSQPPSPSGSQASSSPRSSAQPISNKSPQTSASVLSQSTPVSAASEATVRSSLTATPAQARQPVQDFEMVLPEPPKIDFIETGSIFGDRKRPTVDPSMFQLENGRFRSPGQSKVIQGPGGRTIKVSFVSGFPSTKSLESYRSLTPSTVGKTGRKSTESVAADKQGNLESEGSKIRKITSTKSVKSQSSQDSRASGTSQQGNNEKFNK